MIHNLLAEQIARTKEGSISYADYMNTALYHPSAGYYMKDKQKVGKSGDFYTSSHVHDVFAQVFARFFSHLIENFKLPIEICEIGGGDGKFAEAVIKALKSEATHLYEQLTYSIVETSPYHRTLQKERLPIEATVKQYATLCDMKQTNPTFNGIIFANELFDAFPVYVIEKKAGKLFEVRVTCEAGKLTETMVICENRELIDWLDICGFKLAEGQRIEVPIAMENWLENLAQWLNSGFFITADYGYTYEEWMQPEHRNGSLRGYYKHQLQLNPLLHPGEMDITTHIHLDRVKQVGVESGCSFVGIDKQTHFLLKAGILQFLQEHRDPNPFSEISKRNRGIKSLVLDGGISSAFHVMIQQKGLGEVSWDDLFIK